MTETGTGAAGGTAPHAIPGATSSSGAAGAGGAESRLTGTSIALIYSFPLLFADRAGDRRRGVPNFERLKAMPPPAQKPARERTAERLAWEFAHLEAIALGSKGVDRYLLEPGRLSVSVGTRRPDLQCLVLVSLYEAYRVGLVTVNLYDDEGLGVDDVIALLDSGDGRNVAAYRQHGGAVPAAAAQGGADLVRVSFGKTATSRPVYSIRCAARECMLLIARGYFSGGGRDDKRYKKMAAAIGDWEGKRAEPVRCVELKSRLPAEPGAGAGQRPADRTSTPEAGAREYLREIAPQAYGMLAADEGWRFVPREVAARRVRRQWRSREFFSAVAFGRSVLVANFADPRYQQFQKQWWPRHLGFEDPYFDTNSVMAGLEHGPLSVLEYSVVSQALQYHSKAVIERCFRLVRPMLARSGRRGRRDALRKTVGQRGRLFELRVGLVDNVQKLTELQVREVRELGQMVRQELGLAEDLASIRSRTTEVDSEIQMLEDSRTQRQVNRLTTLISVLGVVIAALQIAVPFWVAGCGGPDGSSASGKSAAEVADERAGRTRDEG